MNINRRKFLKGGLAAGSLAAASSLGMISVAGATETTSESATSKNMSLLAHLPLPHGGMGEGIAIKQLPNGRRIGYFAHERAPIAFSVVDVTDPRNPGLIRQIPTENDQVRANSLTLYDDLLMVARQTNEFGQQPAGFSVHDVSNPEKPRQIGFFDASGPYSRGCHFVWMTDGRYCHITSGMPDFRYKADTGDHQIYVIVDLIDPTNPVEVGRWWLPGQRYEDEETLPRHPVWDRGYRGHNVNVLPSHPDRAYLAYVDGGAITLDISDLENPTLVNRWDYHPPMAGFTHTVMPIFERGLAIVSDESVHDNCVDHPKTVWCVDMSVETNWVSLSTAPLPLELCDVPNGGWMGPHNVHENDELSTAAQLKNTVVASLFAGGVRVYDISNPFRFEEIGYYVPPAPEDSPYDATQINDVYVDENGIIYAIERKADGLFILEYTGEGGLT